VDLVIYLWVANQASTLAGGKLIILVRWHVTSIFR
jgi:hypothetical protein